MIPQGRKVIKRLQFRPLSLRIVVTMPVIKAAKKSVRSDARKSVFNLRVRRAMKVSVKSVSDLIVQKKGKEAMAALPMAYKKIDKALKGGLIKKNTASRKKSRLSKAIKKIS